MKKEGGKKKRKHTRQSAIVPAPAQTYCKTLCSCLWTALTDAWHANMHTVGPYACKHTHTHTNTCAYTQPVSFKTTLTGDTLFSNREKKACSLTGWEEFMPWQAIHPDSAFKYFVKSIAHVYVSFLKKNITYKFR